ncbi:MAG: DUF2510 domain-containing protein [Acidimicrobiia bacterium]|nr:DUF2510 domain-containing protein [Acidimicrobiia bacterium]
MTNGTFPSGWYRDPTGQGDARYWNGVAWTDSVNRGGVTVSVPIAADQSQLPPTPGSEVQVAAPAAAPQTTSSRSPLAVIFGILAVVLLVVVIVLLVNDDESDDPAIPATGVPTVPATDPPSTG